MVAPRHIKAALAVIMMDRMQTAPALFPADTTPHEPIRGTEFRTRVCTTRERVHEYLNEKGSYHDRHPQDIFITPKGLARVIDSSDQTARRRLEFLKEHGVVKLELSGARLCYALAPEFRPETDEYVPTESDVIGVTKKLFDALDDN